MFHAKFDGINGAGWFLEHADPLLKAGLDSEISWNSKECMEVHIPEFLLTVHQIYLHTMSYSIYMYWCVFSCFLEIRFKLLSQKLFLSPVVLIPPPKKRKQQKHIICWAFSTLRFLGYWIIRSPDLLFRIQLSGRIAHPAKLAGLYSTSVQWCIGFCSIPSCRDELVL